LFSLARSYFELKEYERAAYVLKESPCLKSQFLRLYSLFLVSFWL
jgi:hypothetical protein